MDARRHKMRNKSRPSDPRHDGLEKKNPWWKETLPLLAVALLFSTNVCLFGTFEIFFPNRVEFDSSFRDVLPILLGFCMGLMVFLVVVGRLLTHRLRSAFCVFLLTLGLLLWTQGSFLRWGYGEFDGSGIDWRQFTWQGWIDAAIWVTLLSLAIRFHRRLSRHALFIALVFVVLQAGFMVMRVGKQMGEMERTAGSTQKPGIEMEDTLPQELCRLSKSLNVFHIILDSFQTDVFLELVEEDNLTEKLDGFVVFSDNMSVGRRTVLCIPAIFSGRLFDGTQTESEYFRETMENGFHNLLFRKNYVVNLMPHITMMGTSYTNLFSIRSTYAIPRSIRLLRTSCYLLDVSLFRQVPHFLKRFIHNNENWRLSSVVTDPPSHESFHQKMFFRDYISRIEVAHHRPAYHFLHLMPPHPPFVTTSDGKYAREALPNTRENYKNEARYILELFVRFLDKLRELHLYDSSIIVLQGDHGWSFAPVIDGKVFPKKTGKISALLTLKTGSAYGPLRTSSARSTIADIPATLLDLLQLDHSYPGEPLFRLDPSEQRAREIVFVTDRSSSTPTIHRWLVKGSVYDTTSWYEMEAKIAEREIHGYDWGRKLGFGITGNGGPYLTSGWSTTAGTVHWNENESAEMTFGIIPPDRDVELRFVFFSHIVPGKVEKQRIQMTINGVKVKEIVCTQESAQSFDIVVPRRIFETDRMVINFKFPDAVAPSQIGTGRDTRKFAMGIYSFIAQLVDK